MFDFSERAEYLRTNGYVVLQGALGHPLVDLFWEDVERQLAENPDLTLQKYGQILKNSEIQGDTITESVILRIIDMERHSRFIPCVMLHHILQKFLETYLGAKPSVLQTLTYKYSSEQGAHSDLHLVNPPWAGPDYDRGHLIASWIACEDADEENGALIIYPRSHLLKKKTFQEFGDYGKYVEYLKALCSDSGISAETFRAKKGDVLFWHGDFVHAGGEIRNRSLTRKSLVVHYTRFPADFVPVDPMLQRFTYGSGSYFKPAVTASVRPKTS